MQAVYDAVRKACFSDDGRNEIAALKNKFGDDLDLTFDDNFALRTAIERDDAVLASYLLTDVSVIQFEADHNFPCMRLAIDKKSPSVQLFLVGISFAETDIEIPNDLVRIANELKRREKEKLQATTINNPAPVVAFSGFRTDVNFKASFASAGEKNKRKGWKRFICG